MRKRERAYQIGPIILLLISEPYQIIYSEVVYLEYFSDVFNYILQSCITMFYFYRVTTIYGFSAKKMYRYIFKNFHYCRSQLFKTNYIYSLHRHMFALKLLFSENNRCHLLSFVFEIRWKRVFILVQRFGGCATVRIRDEEFDDSKIGAR